VGTPVNHPNDENLSLGTPEMKKLLSNFALFYISRRTAVALSGAEIAGSLIEGSLGTRDSLYYHRRILEAIKALDGSRAEALMEQRFERTVRRLKRKQGRDGKSCAGRKADGKA
jgi:DNA-binding GntR family transcriptional regulator